MCSYEERRQKFLEGMGEASVAIIPSGQEVLRTEDSAYRFRPESDFFYLTGVDEPDALLVLAPHLSEEREVLFLAPRDPARAVWTGARPAFEKVREIAGVDTVYTHDLFETSLAKYLTGARRLYYQLGNLPDLDREIIREIRRLKRTRGRRSLVPVEIVDPGVLLHEQRLYKAPEEILTLQIAAMITSQAHRLAMRVTRPGISERTLETILDAAFRMGGGEGPGYPTIVACGANATTLHYVKNTAPLKDGDLVLVDAGCEFSFYTADITRTFPVNGRFSGPQRAVYEVVLKAQKAAIASIRPGVTMEDVHAVAVEVLTDGLVALGVLKGTVSDLVASEAYRPFFMHRTSHWLGMEVHDVGEYVREGKSRALEPGMVLTVEPGLYFRDGVDGVPETLKGIGVRIEDDILVTEEGHSLLTTDVPKEIDELEALVGSERRK